MKNSLSRFAALTILACAAARPATAQISYDRILLPVMVSRAPGLFGSVWTSELILYNANSFPLQVKWTTPCVPFCLPLAQPEATYGLVAAEPADNPGLVLYVQRPSDNVWLASRVYDETRQAATFGTEIPIVRE